MPLFGSFRQRLSLTAVALFVSGTAFADGLNVSCGAMMKFDPVLQSSLKSLFSPEAKHVELGSGFAYIDDPACTTCLFNVQIQDGDTAAEMIIQHFGVTANLPLLRREIPLIVKLAHQLSANLNIQLAEGNLMFSLDMNGASMLRVTQPSAASLDGKPRYPRLEIEFRSNQIRLVAGTSAGYVIEGRSVVEHSGVSHGWGVMIEATDAKNVVIDTVSLKAKYMVGPMASPQLRLLLEVARRMAWEESPQVENVILHAQDTSLVAPRDRHF